MSFLSSTKSQAALVFALLLLVAGVGFFAGRGCRSPDPELALARERIEERDRTIDSLEARDASLARGLDSLADAKAGSDAAVLEARAAAREAQEALAAISLPEDLPADELVILADSLVPPVVRREDGYLVSRKFVELSILNHRRVLGYEKIAHRLGAQISAMEESVLVRDREISALELRNGVLRREIALREHNRQDLERSILLLERHRRRQWIWKAAAVGGTVVAVGTLLLKK